MLRGKSKNMSNRSQYNLAPSQPSFPTTESSGYPNTTKEKGSNLKSHLVKMIEVFKGDTNNSLKETQENTNR